MKMGFLLLFLCLFACFPSENYHSIFARENEVVGFYLIWNKVFFFFKLKYAALFPALMCCCFTLLLHNLGKQ